MARTHKALFLAVTLLVACERTCTSDLWHNLCMHILLMWHLWLTFKSTCCDTCLAVSCLTCDFHVSVTCACSVKV